MGGLNEYYLWKLGSQMIDEDANQWQQALSVWDQGGQRGVVRLSKRTPNSDSSRLILWLNVDLGTRNVRCKAAPIHNLKEIIKVVEIEHAGSFVQRDGR